MTNGLLSVTLIPTVMQPVTQEPSASVTIMMDGVQQNSGDFATVLSEMQSLAKVEATSGPGQIDLSQIEAETDQIVLDTVADAQPVDLLMQLHVSALITPASDLHPVEPKQEKSESTGERADTIPLSNEQSDVTTQIVLAAYSQPGRMPSANIPAQPSADLLQNVAALTTESVTEHASAQTRQQELEPARTMTGDKKTVAAVTEIPETPVTVQPEPLIRAVVNTPPETPVDRLQNVAALTDQPAVTAAPSAKLNAELAAVEPRPAVTLTTEFVAEHAPAQTRQQELEPARTMTGNKKTAAAVTEIPQTPVTVQPEPLIRAVVNTPAQTPIDRLQNVAALTDQPVVTTAPSVKLNTELAAVEPRPAVALTTESVAERTPAQIRQQEFEPARTMIGDKQAVAAVTETPETSITAQPEPLNKAAVNKPAQTPVDSLQNVAALTDQPAAPSVKLNAELAAVEPRPTVVLTAESVAEHAPAQTRQQEFEPARTMTGDKQTVAAVTETPETPATAQPEPLIRAAVNTPAQTPVDWLQNVAALTDRPVVTEHAAEQPTKAASPMESELEIQLSQLRPITARVAATPAVADNRSAMLVREIRGTRQPFAAEQQIEQVLANNEPSIENEAAPSIQIAASGNESTFDSESALSNQNQQNTADDHQTPVQDMRGQLNTEHQKSSAVSTKLITPEPVRQTAPEQVVQQVKERLEHHDVKQGNQQITLTLSPDGLGELKMNLNLQGQKLSVEIVAENRSVRDVIAQHTEALKESLARQNITMESFDVTTGGKGSGNQGQNQNAWREMAQQQQQQQFWTLPRNFQTAQADLPSGLAAYQKQQGQSMLDIHY